MTETAKVLVVDDEEANRDLLSRRLERSGFRVDCTDSGKGALGLIDTVQYDVVLLDSMMPGMSGIEVLKLLRAVHTPDQLPVIMVTAVTDSDRVAEALDLGANDYVIKPIDFQIALARIRSQVSRKRAESALRISEERYALAVRGANDGLWDWNLANGQVYFSPRWKSMLGYQDGEIGKSPEEWLGRVYEQDRAGLEASIQAHLSRTTSAFEHEFRIRHRDGSCHWMSSRGVAVMDAAGTAVRLAGSSSDVTLKKSTDVLTNLPNRLMLTDRLTGALARLASDGESFALLFLDLDRFKLVNDSLGHVAGDHLLIEVGRNLREALSTSGELAAESSMVARIGGDEFAVLLDRNISPETAGSLAERLLHVCRQAFHVDGHTVFCSASIGLALGDAGYRNPDDVIRDADTAMYAAKASGKGRWALFNGNMRDAARARLHMETELRLALERKEFRVYYQPRVRLETGHICGFEALVRWLHPLRGIVGPDEFIPIAEETGLINELGLWVLREACRQMRAWQDSFPACPPLDISVNVSVRQCHEPHLAANVRAVLAETGLAAASLQLEITESLLLTDLVEAKVLLDSLKAIGVGLKVDDFGTGYSSLRYLSELPFDSLKIDRSFTQRLAEGDPDSEELVKTIIAMAQNLKLEAIAEGVENVAQIELLKAAGCEYGQGFFYSRPVDAASAESLIEIQSIYEKEPK